MPRVVVVGSGMSGLCAVHYLREAGVTDITVLEKRSEVGGTWRDNTYPGLACDVPSRFYQFTFAPNPDWSHLFSPGAEIAAYFNKVADDLGMRRLVHHCQEVTSVERRDGEWVAHTATGDTWHADFVVSAAGVLHHPHVPEIPGAQDFAGAMFHSARWDHSVPLEGARVGIIGSGSTGVQITTALSTVASRVSVFQRSPHWVVTVPNPAYPRVLRQAHRLVPPLNRVGYLAYRAGLEAIAQALTEDGRRRRVFDAVVRRSLAGVRDPELRSKLRPDYQPGCRRLVMSPGYFKAVQRETVDVVTDGIDRITKAGVRTADGREHELDVLVLATGFDAHAFIRPASVIGDSGRTLDDIWAEGPKAYYGVAVPGLANLFMLMGPHSPVGNYSLTAIAEAQARFIAGWIGRWAQGEFDTVEVTDEAYRAHQEAMSEALPGTVWASGCTSWYIGGDGLPELWPWTPERYRKAMRAPVEDHWRRSRSAVAPRSHEENYA
ncbi:flavin-containing monooxygenase [Nocardioides sp. LML1-1-1.1]|uniref:flavin-containing monooxygenase n=1 Tax=Nocardioides sp. LML1-1-1.1 TaxID=3135248 RepID=UPI0034301446